MELFNCKHYLPYKVINEISVAVQIQIKFTKFNKEKWRKQLFAQRAVVVIFKMSTLIIRTFTAYAHMWCTCVRVYACMDKFKLNAYRCAF